jgi:RNA-directed DNA polymerase
MATRLTPQEFHSGGSDSITESAAAEEVLLRAWRMVRSAGGAAGSDRQEIEQFALQEKKELTDIRDRMRKGKYQYSRLRYAPIPKSNGKFRELGIPTIRDRIVLQAIKLVLEPDCEKHMSDCSHAYRAQRGAMTALAAIEEGMRRGRPFVLETDIRQFFDSIRHTGLWRQLVAIDARVQKCPLVRAAMTLSTGWWPARKGVAQGSPLSPLLANVALIEFDRNIHRDEWTVVRYADDLVLLCHTHEEAAQALTTVERELKKIGLEIHPDKTRIVDGRAESFSFLGFEFHPDRIVPSGGNLSELRDGISAWCNPHSGHSWDERMERINGLLRSFAWYYHKTDASRLFWSLDEFVAEQLAALELAIGSPEHPWRNRIVKMSQMREATWKGSRRKGRGWSGYGK